MSEFVFKTEKLSKEYVTRHKTVKALDEVDLEIRRGEFVTITGHSGSGRTIFLNTHNLDEAQRICDRIGILNTRLVAVGTPAELEGSVHGRKTAVRIRHVNDAILFALKKLQLRNMTTDGDILTIDVVDPEEENPVIARAIVEAGGDLESLSEFRSTLEDAYLRLVREP